MSDLVLAGLPLSFGRNGRGSGKPSAKRRRNDCDSPEQLSAEVELARMKSNPALSELFDSVLMPPCVTLDRSADTSQKGVDISLDIAKLESETAEILAKLQKTKAAFDNFNDESFNWARRCCNPFEAVGNGGFINRSAVKLASIHAFCKIAPDLLPPSSDTISCKSNPSVFRFVDVCGGPGGFSEFLLTSSLKAGVRCCGHGISLSAGVMSSGDSSDREPVECDWTLDSIDVLSRVPDTSTSRTDPAINSIFYRSTDASVEYHIVNGPTNDGNIYSQCNQDAFVSTVCSGVNASVSVSVSGVDWAVCDGGFASARDRSDQEAVMFRLIVCEVLVSLRCLKDGGCMVLKLFDTYTKQSKSLLFVLHKLFRVLTICKPVSSRPASSERYLICKHYCSTGASGVTAADVIERLSAINRHLATHPHSVQSDGSLVHVVGCESSDSVRYLYPIVHGDEATLVVPWSIVVADSAFSHWIAKCNHLFTSGQLSACTSILSLLCEDDELPCTAMSLSRSEREALALYCCEVWGCPHRALACDNRKE